MAVLHVTSTHRLQKASLPQQARPRGPRCAITRASQGSSRQQAAPDTAPTAVTRAALLRSGALLAGVAALPQPPAAQAEAASATAAAAAAADLSSAAAAAVEGGASSLGKVRAPPKQFSAAPLQKCCPAFATAPGPPRRCQLRCNTCSLISNNFAQVVLRTLSDCQLAVSVYPTFSYNAGGGGGSGTLRRGEDGLLHVSFDPDTLQIPAIQCVGCG